MGQPGRLHGVTPWLLAIAFLASEAVAGAVTATDEDGNVYRVEGFTEVYEPAEWIHPPQTNAETLLLVLRTATGSEREMEFPFADMKRIDFDPAYTDPKATGSVPAWYPVRIARRDGSLVTLGRGPRCVVTDASGRTVELIPLSDERRVYDRQSGYAERGYVFRYGSLSGVTGIGGSPVSKPALLTGFAGSQAGKPFHITYGPANRVRSVEFE